MLIIKHLKLHIPPKTDNARLRSPLLKRLKVLIVATPNLLAQISPHLHKQIYKIFTNRGFKSNVFIDKNPFFLT
jgi:hypothetical protein